MGNAEARRQSEAIARAGHTIDVVWQRQLPPSYVHTVLQIQIWSQTIGKFDLNSFREKVKKGKSDPDTEQDKIVRIDNTGSYIFITIVYVSNSRWLKSVAKKSLMDTCSLFKVAVDKKKTIDKPIVGALELPIVGRSECRRSRNL
jgi:hypothetical protein